MKRKVSVVIMDLDNTLWDWVEIWYQSFNAMFEKVLEISNIDEKTLKKEFKEIHEKHGTSEYSFSIQELPSLKKKHQGEDLLAIYSNAIQTHREMRKKYSRLYPSILKTLKKLKSKGCLLIGYTESMAYYSNRRIKDFGLDGCLDLLYYTQDHPFPDDVTMPYPGEYSQLEFTGTKQLPITERKPNPGILNMIIEDAKARKSETIYVGDSKMKDILMAKKARVTDVWAKYGDAINRKEYGLLKEVTHWPVKIVNEQKNLDISPKYTLEKSFKELLKLFRFVRFSPEITPRSMDTNPTGEDEYKTCLDIWKKVIDVQMHFNEIEMKIRNLALTLLTAVIGTSGLLLKERIFISLVVSQIPLATMVLLGGIVGWIAFYMMDYHWYHRLLYGAINQGMFIENRLKSKYPEIMLTNEIKNLSPGKLFFIKVGSKRRIQLFYLFGVIVLLLLIVFTASFKESPKSTPDPKEKTHMVAWFNQKK
jgi:FMN phosphatase YigB (HAD superfamily)